MKMNEVVPYNDGETRTLIVHTPGGKRRLFAVYRKSAASYLITLLKPAEEAEIPAVESSPALTESTDVASLL